MGHNNAVSANLFLNLILSSPYYLAVTHKSQIQHTCLSFKIDSLLQLKHITLASHYLAVKLITAFSSFFGEGKEIEWKLHSIVVLT